MIFTSSWDDGSKYDLKLADLLSKYGIKGTFYVPIHNRERNDSLTSKQIREISNSFEIGCHTYHHVPLSEMSLEGAEKEIVQSKSEIEGILGRQIKGFCFPRGKYKRHYIPLLKKNGFIFARTINMFQVEFFPDFFLHTTLQVFNHNSIVYLRHLCKRGQLNKMILFWKGLIKYQKWNDLFKYIIEYSALMDLKTPVFHLWGHSWEIEEYNLWGELKDFFEYIKKNDQIKFCDNEELFQNECLKNK